jgi:hypothetical protein
MAWVKFNGTGTPSIYDSHNISSISDNLVGYFSCNYTTGPGSQSSSACAVACCSNGSNTHNELAGVHTFASAYFNINTSTASNGAAADWHNTHGVVFGDPSSV